MIRLWAPMKSNLFLIHNPYKQYTRIFNRSKNEKWVLFNKNKILINYTVNRMNTLEKVNLTTDELCKLLNIEGTLKKMILEIYEGCKLKPYDTKNYDPQISIVTRNSWIGPSLQKKLNL